MSMAILGDAHLERVLQVIAERTLAVLGLRNVTIFLSGPDGRLDPATEAGEPLHDVEARERELNARWAIETGKATERYALAGETRVTRPVELGRETRADE